VRGIRGAIERSFEQIIIFYECLVKEGNNFTKLAGGGGEELRGSAGNSDGGKNIKGRGEQLHLKDRGGRNSY